MKYLLDTHTLLWLDSDPTKLSTEAAALCQNRKHQLLMSVASAWEIQIKMQTGKLKLPTSLADIVAGQQKANGVQLLSIELAHILDLAALPDYHKDPFDRLLIAQARLEGAILISNDPIISRYPVTVVW